MTLIIEVIHIDKRYTPRITPFYKVVAVCATQTIARGWLRNTAIQLYHRNISIGLYPDHLTVIENPGFRLGFQHYIMKEVTLYGDSMGDHVYNLQFRYGCYFADNSVPYGYYDLGWFSSINWAHKTREWKFIHKQVEKYDGVDTDTLQVIRRMDENHIINFMPSLQIQEFPLLQ